jgi:hypothetical protein
MGEKRAMTGIKLGVVYGDDNKALLAACKGGAYACRR